MSKPWIEFAKHLDNVVDPSEFLVDVPPKLESKEALLRTLADKLEFPEYYGMNWDALKDCLTDLSWISEKRIRIRHHDLPRLPLDGVSTYLSILVFAADDWVQDDDHELIVEFPAECKETILPMIDRTIA